MLRVTATAHFGGPFACYMRPPFGERELKLSLPTVASDSAHGRGHQRLVLAKFRALFQKLEVAASRLFADGRSSTLLGHTPDAADRPLRRGSGH